MIDDFKNCPPTTFDDPEFIEAWEEFLERKKKPPSEKELRLEEERMAVVNVDMDQLGLLEDLSFMTDSDKDKICRWNEYAEKLPKPAATVPAQYTFLSPTQVAEENKIVAGQFILMEFLDPSRFYLTPEPALQPEYKMRLKLREFYKQGRNDQWYRIKREQLVVGAPVACPYSDSADNYHRAVIAQIYTYRHNPHVRLLIYYVDWGTMERVDYDKCRFLPHHFLEGPGAVCQIVLAKLDAVKTLVTPMSNHWKTLRANMGEMMNKRSVLVDIVDYVDTDRQKWITVRDVTYNRWNDTTNAYQLLSLRKTVLASKIVLEAERVATSASSSGATEDLGRCKRLFTFHLARNPIPTPSADDDSTSARCTRRVRARPRPNAASDEQPSGSGAARARPDRPQRIVLPPRPVNGPALPPVSVRGSGELRYADDDEPSTSSGLISATCPRSRPALAVQPPRELTVTQAPPTCPLAEPSPLRTCTPIAQPRSTQPPTPAVVSASVSAPTANSNATLATVAPTRSAQPSAPAVVSAAARVPTANSNATTTDVTPTHGGCRPKTTQPPPQPAPGFVEVPTADLLGLGDPMPAPSRPPPRRGDYSQQNRRQMAIGTSNEIGPQRCVVPPQTGRMGDSGQCAASASAPPIQNQAPARSLPLGGMGRGKPLRTNLPPAPPSHPHIAPMAKYPSQPTGRAAVFRDGNPVNMSPTLSRESSNGIYGQPPQSLMALRVKTPPAINESRLNQLRLCREGDDESAAGASLTNAPPPPKLTQPQQQDPAQNMAKKSGFSEATMKALNAHHNNFDWEAHLKRINGHAADDGDID